MPNEQEKEKLRIVQMRIMNKKEIKIFGAIIFKFVIKIVEDDVMSAFIQVVNKKPTITFGSKYVRDHSIPELTFTLLHEFMHFILNHIGRTKEYYHPVIMNLAADHVTNEILMKDIDSGYLKIDVCSKPDGLFIIKELTGKNYTFEKTYEWLIKNKAESQKIKCTGECKSGNPDPSDPSDPDSECKCNTHKYNIKNQKGKFTPDIKESENTSKEDVAKVIEGIKSDIRSAADQENNMLTKGSEGSKILEMIKELIKIKIPWEVLMEHAIKTHVTISMENRSWKNPNKRFRAHNIMIPGYGEEQTGTKLIVCVDASGSISTDDLKRCMYVIRKAIIHFTEIVVLQHDVVVTKINRLTRDNFESEFEETCNITGRGGTSHVDVFKQIGKENEENNDISLIVLITDFCSDIEEIYDDKKFSWVGEIPVKVIVNNSDYQIPEHIDKAPIIMLDD